MFVVATIFAVLAACGFWLSSLLSLTVTVKNVGSEPLRSVTVQVTGGSYELGDLPPGIERSTTVNPAGESIISIDLIDSRGQANTLQVDCYIDKGMWGVVSLEVTDHTVEKWSMVR